MSSTKSMQEAVHEATLMLPYYPRDSHQSELDPCVQGGMDVNFNSLYDLHNSLDRFRNWVHHKNESGHARIIQPRLFVSGGEQNACELIEQFFVWAYMDKHNIAQYYNMVSGCTQPCTKPLIPNSIVETKTDGATKEHAKTDGATKEETRDVVVMPSEKCAVISTQSTATEAIVTSESNSLSSMDLDLASVDELKDKIRACQDMDSIETKRIRSILCKLRSLDIDTLKKRKLSRKKMIAQIERQVRPTRRKRTKKTKARALTPAVTEVHVSTEVVSHHGATPNVTDVPPVSTEAVTVASSRGATQNGTDVPSVSTEAVTVASSRGATQNVTDVPSVSTETIAVSVASTTSPSPSSPPLTAKTASALDFDIITKEELCCKLKLGTEFLEERTTTNRWAVPNKIRWRIQSVLTGLDYIRFEKRKYPVKRTNIAIRKLVSSM